MNRGYFRRRITVDLDRELEQARKELDIKIKHGESMREQSEDSRTISDLLSEVVELLRKRGIEATEAQVRTWAVDMVKGYHEFSQTKTTIRQWLVGVIEKSHIPTMCLHICFGDAKQ